MNNDVTLYHSLLIGDSDCCGKGDNSCQSNAKYSFSRYKPCKLLAYLNFRKASTNYLLPREYDRRGSIVVRAHASRAEGLRLDPDSMP